MTLPPVCRHANVEDLHPVLANRVAALCADPRMEGRLCVVSGVRSHQEQRYLYNCYLTKACNGGNLAANPDAYNGNRWGVQHRGSHHMQQSDGHGYAVDLNYSELPTHLQAILEQVAGEYLLLRTVPSEQWHYSMVFDDWTTTFHTGDDDMTPEQADKLIAKADQLIAQQAEAIDLLHQLVVSTVDQDGVPGVEHLRVVNREAQRISRAVGGQ